MRKAPPQALAHFPVSCRNGTGAVTLSERGARPITERSFVLGGVMHHDTHDVADTFRSEAHRCWKNATAMYCRALAHRSLGEGGSAGRDADTRRLYVEMAICWAALAAEAEKRVSLAYRESPSPNHTTNGDDRCPTAPEEPPTLAAADPR